MKNIYKASIDSIEQYGTNFSISFEQKSFKLNGKYVIKNGNYNGVLGIEKCESLDDFISNIEHLYNHYKHSIPSEQTSSKSRNYFIALREKYLDDEDMFFGKRRHLSQFELEFYILSQILLGFEWDDSMGKWFWQSKSDNDLILLKKWF